MLLLVAVGGKSWSVTQEGKQKVATEQKATAADERQPDAARMSELSLDAVVIPASSFDFAQTFYLLPPPTWRFVEVASALPASFSEPFHFFSYFRKVFGHHIAINAP
ncbi:hypothetical protein [Telluribacter sp.]|jgi:hypothetical protein|uniref:hypothetical protein n=1 Tax=Telluribacter sp. TaxID=1978767 RepID=UPI002E0DA309|nr:hypothetical protein [Telluribacter sp.]